MRCTSPRTVGFQPDGKTISWSSKTYSKEYATFQMPCGKCLSCRLEYARQWAVRCVHEAQMHENNAFITLTYSNETLSSDKLYYVDFQLFAKRLRKKIFDDYIKNYGRENWNILEKSEKKKILDQIAISIFVTGEYGDKTKRPHWHACIFNWRPQDAVYKYSNDRGDRVYSSDTLDTLWGKGITEFGDVTFESAGYVARYAAKKLTHGNDDAHEFQPISKKSSRHAIGKRWLEKYWPDLFNYGELHVQGKPCGSIPRYYEKWLQKHQPEAWEKYVTITKQKKIEEAAKKALLDRQSEMAANERRREQRGYQATAQTTRTKARQVILESKFKQLQQMRKL